MKRLATTALIALVLVLGACASENWGSPGPTPPATSAAPTATTPSTWTPADSPPPMASVDGAAPRASALDAGVPRAMDAAAPPR
jgi:hypothetical protein